ncbi:hypothetical protein FOFC_14092 [Fusarium oxysporum]|nr:hypothetical protein FOFC_14092 [Fusarium oxysporum]
MSEVAVLSRFNLSMDPHAQVLICCHDTCRIALLPSPAQVSEHLRKKHNIPAAERRLVTDLLKARILPLGCFLSSLVTSSTLCSISQSTTLAKGEQDDIEPKNLLSSMKTYLSSLRRSIWAQARPTSTNANKFVETKKLLKSPQ